MKKSFSLSVFPEIDRAGEYQLINAGFDFLYKQATYSLHLYEYDGVLRLNEQEVPFKAGDLSCESPGDVYSINADKPGRHWCIHFYAPPDQDGIQFDVNQYIALGPNSVFILEQLKHITRLFNTANSPIDKVEASHRLKALLISLNRINISKTRESRSRSNFLWQELFELIDDNLNSSLSSAYLAKKLNINPRSLAQKFKKQYKFTLAQYILKKRIDLAKSLLTTSRHTINEVGDLVGISDPQYFNKQFRKVTGISPSSYRDENKPYLLKVDDDISILGGEWKEE